MVSVIGDWPVTSDSSALTDSEKLLLNRLGLVFCLFLIPKVSFHVESIYLVQHLCPLPTPLLLP